MFAQRNGDEAKPYKYHVDFDHYLKIKSIDEVIEWGEKATSTSIADEFGVHDLMHTKHFVETKDNLTIFNVLLNELAIDTFIQLFLSCLFLFLLFISDLESLVTRSLTHSHIRTTAIFENSISTGCILSQYIHVWHCGQRQCDRCAQQIRSVDTCVPRLCPLFCLSLYL